MTKLDVWMGKRDDQWLAAALECSRSQASRIRRGKSKPSPARAFQIEKLTRGKVKAADLLAEPGGTSLEELANAKAASRFGEVAA